MGGELPWVGRDSSAELKGNIEHRTSNIERPILSHPLDVGCWMFDVLKLPPHPDRRQYRHHLLPVVSAKEQVAVFVDIGPVIV